MQAVLELGAPSSAGLAESLSGLSTTNPVWSNPKCPSAIAGGGGGRIQINICLSILSCFSRPRMSGVWHIASEPISKFDLLSSVKQVYGLNVQIEPDETVIIDRSLNAGRFQQSTGFVPPP